MSETRTSPFFRRILIMMPLAFLTIVISMFATAAMFARQDGLAPGPAALKALQQLPQKLPPAVVGWIIGFGVILLMYARRPVQQESPVERGRIMWQRWRLVTAILAVPFLLIALVGMTYHLATGQWQDLDWLLAFLFVYFAAMLACLWLQRPSSERLYAIETGDRSRIMDERAQLVQGKAAQTTLSIFAAVLILGGGLYETVGLGRWPLLTGVELLVLLSVWVAAATYWDRRL